MIKRKVMSGLLAFAMMLGIGATAMVGNEKSDVVAEAAATNPLIMDKMCISFTSDKKMKIDMGFSTNTNYYIKLDFHRFNSGILSGTPTFSKLLNKQGTTTYNLSTSQLGSAYRVFASVVKKDPKTAKYTCIQPAVFEASNANLKAYTSIDQMYNSKQYKKNGKYVWAASAVDIYVPSYNTTDGDVIYRVKSKYNSKSGRTQAVIYYIPALKSGKKITDINSLAISYQYDETQKNRTVRQKTLYVYSFVQGKATWRPSIAAGTTGSIFYSYHPDTTAGKNLMVITIELPNSACEYKNVGVTITRTMFNPRLTLGTRTEQYKSAFYCNKKLSSQ